MPDYVEQWLPVGWVGAVGAVAAAVWLWRTVVGPMVKRVLSAARQVEDFLESWRGRPERPGYPAEPGMPARVATIEALVPGWTAALAEHAAASAEILNEVRPNHGGSAHDALAAQIRSLDERLDRLIDAQLATSGAIDRVEADKHDAHATIMGRPNRIEHIYTGGEES